MRTVSFVEHLELDISGNVFNKALVLGDVDNDQGFELAVGTVNGELLIYKGEDPKPWRRATDLGMITCIEIGDILNHGINYLVTSSVEGWCHIFAVKPDSSQDVVDGEDPQSRILKPVHKQHLVANSKVLLIADINGDGKRELVIGCSDRRVRSYRWQEPPGDLLSGSVASASGTGTAPGSGLFSGKFVPSESWRLEGQLSSMTVHKQRDGRLDLMVSQPGGAFVTLLGSNQQPHKLPGEPSTVRKKQTSPEKKDTKSPEKVTKDKSTSEKKSPEKNIVEKKTPIDSKPPDENISSDECRSLLSGPTLVYHPLGTARARNPGVTTEVLGNISRCRKGEDTAVTGPNYYAICTLDGTLTLVDDDKILWSLYVDHQLFTLSKLDVTGNGTEEVIACSWDGQTYIVNLNRDVVRFQFQENVAAFYAGYFALSGSENVPCLIYVTFSNRIMVYHNIRFRDVGCSNLLETMREQEGVQDLLNYFNVDASRPNEVKQLYHWCLYGMRSNPS